MGGLFVKGVACPLKIGGTFWSTTLSKIPPPIFHWAQAVPTRYGDRSQNFQKITCLL